MQELQVLGLPNVLFFDAQSQPNPQLRLQGLFPPMIYKGSWISVSATSIVKRLVGVFDRDKDNRLYTGITTDVARRISQHQAGNGAKNLRGRGPLTLHWHSAIGDRSQAQKVEYRLKQWPKRAKNNYRNIRNGLNPCLFHKIRRILYFITSNAVYSL